MYALAVAGENFTARAVLSACINSNFQNLTWVKGIGRREKSPAATLAGACTLPANLTRILIALHATDALLEVGHQPDREQVRIGTSGFLLSELPLGKFAHDRYGAPHLNIEHYHWPHILPVDLSLGDAAELSELKQTHGVVIDCTPHKTPQPNPTHQLWHACMPLDQDYSHSNVTWLGQRQTAWQFSTREQQHFYFITPVGQPPEAAAWHPLVGHAAVLARPVCTFNGYTPAMADQWQKGGVAYVGNAVYRTNPYLRESAALGLEDAWVLSRMLENYEDEIHDGLREYEKYRSARARRVARNATHHAVQLNHTRPIKRILHYLNVALSSRFLPEIAMHRIDWFYGYDCIRGFR